MTALSKIQLAGFILSFVDGRLDVTPTKQSLTDTQREYIREHKDEIIAELKAEKNNVFVTCRKCLHFKCHNAHGKGAGICSIGGAYGDWSGTLHQCSLFNAAVEWIELPSPKPNALLVACFTPSGKVIEVEARDPEHAAYLIRMNPKRVIP